MSDNYVIIIPADPEFVPTEQAQRAALEYFQEIAPSADEIESETHQLPQFIDCGGNFEWIRCPNCKTTVCTDWWNERMEADSNDDGFQLETIAIPCCGFSGTLNDLDYSFPQGFARFELGAMNPNLGELNNAVKLRFESLLGCTIKVIYQHI
ncbi:hypothetical protein [Calycomorphotria hydatis]|uniref:Uncharacterized protein n=1 Tax=Calycomorphotria hydatis TaxID=2528027 RepID=A0A517TDW5_9PLAN|nr:hypothetical protein [Calycomorphotria hydatis]QDT66564.1 hypothetical protein V22_38340 [Calycomorphotria hydatis]